MKLEHLEKVTSLAQQRKYLTGLYGEIVKKHPAEIEVDVVGYGIRYFFDAERFRSFVVGEMQALNLELHNLGVDLPERR